MVSEIAIWFSKLHAITYAGGNLFNVINSRLVTVLPGSRHQIHRVQEAFPQYLELYQKAYEIFLKTEYEFLSSTTKRYLIHGDAHPDNIMLTNGGRLGVIDFSDLSYADFARDLGCFLEQTEYMCSKRDFTKDEIAEIKQLFMDTYLHEAKIEMTADLQKRIDNYYYWTKIRTMSYILFSGAMERDAETLARAEVLAKELKQGLGI
jgi:thiamine kinase-like enzyme